MTKFEPKNWLLFTAGLAAICLPGCATVASSYATNRPSPGVHPAGLVYDLPLKTMSVSVGSNRFGLFVAVHDVRVEGDGSASFVLSYQPDSSAADTFDAAIDPATRLLTTVKVEADSKAADAVAAFARSAGQLTGVFETKRNGATRLYAIRPLTYWPTASTTKEEAQQQLTKFNSEINALVADVVEVQGCRMKNESVLAADRRSAICGPGGAIKPGSIPRVDIMIDYAPFRSQVGGVDCSIGLCTRHQATAQMTLSAPGSSDFARLPLPNGSEPVPLPLRRVAFTKATTEYTLVDGLVTKTAFSKGAELPAVFAAVGSLPGQFIGGAVDGFKQGANLRKPRTDAAASPSGAAAAGANAAGTPTPTASTGADGTGHTEANLPNRTESAFEAGLLMIVYPLPQPEIDRSPLSTASPPSPSSTATDTQLGPTTEPGPASASAGGRG